jgi:hypothetical protein
MKPLLALLAIVALTSCSNDYATATPGFYKEVTPVDPDAQFGVFVGRGPYLGGPRIEIIPVK